MPKIKSLPDDPVSTMLAFWVFVMALICVSGFAKAQVTNDNTPYLPLGGVVLDDEVLQAGQIGGYRLGQIEEVAPPPTTTPAPPQWRTKLVEVAPGEFVEMVRVEDAEVAIARERLLCARRARMPIVRNWAPLLRVNEDVLPPRVEELDPNVLIDEIRIDGKRRVDRPK